MRSKDYNFLKLCYDRKVANDDKLRQFVKYNAITPEEFEEITGNKY